MKHFRSCAFLLTPMLLACGETTEVEEDREMPDLEAAPVADYGRDVPSLDPAEDVEPDDCNARLASPYLGEEADADTRGELLSAVAPVTHVRWLGPDEEPGEEVIPDRLTVRLGGDDSILDVSCG